MTDPFYTPEQRRADQLAVNEALRPLNEAFFAAHGLTHAQGKALVLAGLPLPERPVSRSHPGPAPRPAGAPGTARPVRAA